PREKATLEELKRETVQREAALEEAEKGIVILEQYQAEGTQLPARLERAYERISKGRTALQERLVELNAETKALEAALGKTEAPEVRVRRFIYPNVNIKLKEITYENQSKTTHTAFF